MKTINHKNLELNIGAGRDECEDIKAVGWFPLYNDIVVASKRGEDRFFLAPRDRKTDISEAKVLEGRYLYIGPGRCTLQVSFDNWLNVNMDETYMIRLLIAGALKVVVSINHLPMSISGMPEYKQAIRENRVVIV